MVGGWTQAPGPVAEIYDPTSGANGSFTNLSSTLPGFAWPTQHTATLITTGPHAGEVLIAGGWGSPTLGESYFFDPLTDTFNNGPALLTRRFDHTATTLPNGRIVFAGGVINSSDYTNTSSVEIYDPATGQQSYIGNLIAERNTHSADLVTTPDGLRLAVAAGYGHSAIVGNSLEQFDLGSLDGESGDFASATSMNQSRRGHVAVQLDNGKVLLAGSDALNTPGAELYNPATNTTTATGSMLTARCYGCSYAKLQDGKVLVTGGWNGGGVFNTGEIYDPTTGQFSATTGNMTAPRLDHSSVLLNNGKVLILGGYDGTTPHASAELFDPVAGTFTATGSMAGVRYRATAIKLPNGKVLVVGGFSTGSNVVTSAELYDPIAETFSVTGSMVTPRFTEEPVLLNDGRVLFAGGWNGVNLNSAEIYTPGTGTFTAVGSMSTPRSGHFAVKLANGEVVVGGGHDGTNEVYVVEVFSPLTNAFTQIANLPTAQVNARAIALADGRIMITGGTTAAIIMNTVQYFVP